MNDENEIDDLFKSRFSNPENQPSFDEKDWQGMEGMLGGRARRRGLIYWAPRLGAAAAMLLLAGGWWLFSGRKQTSVGVSGPALTHNTNQKNSGTNGGAIRQPNAEHRKEQATVSIAKNLPSGKADSHLNPFLSPSAAGTRRVAGTVPLSADTIPAAPQRDELAALISRQNTAVSQAALPAVDLQSMSYTNASLASHDTTPVKKATLRVKALYRPQYALTVWAAPDENSAGGSQSKLGDNIGLLFSAGLTKRLTVSTGALYSNKPYLTSFADYHTDYKFAVSPQSVYTDCQMLDIPVNVAYTLYNKHQNTFSLGTGLSSYIMFHQGYTYNYADPYTPGPTNYNAPGIGKYYFGILNLNATYERRLNSRVGFSIQPYYKLPLSNVGYSQVRLQSTGIAAGLSWNFSPPLKP
jgi:hypothetical protein